jgi:hypothetical protein
VPHKIVLKYCEAFGKAESAIRFADYSISSLATSAQAREDCCALPVVAPKGVSIAAVNELRYSAYHFSKALSLKIDPAFDAQTKKRIKYERADQIQRALRHCYRARFDALEATVLHFIRDFKAFAEDYKTIHSEGDGLHEHQHTIEKTLDFLNTETARDTEEKCAVLQKAIDNLRPGYLFCLSMRSRFNNVLAEMETQSVIIQEQSRKLERQDAQLSEQSQKLDAHDKNCTRQFWLGLIIGVAASIIIGFISHIFF